MFFRFVFFFYLKLFFFCPFASSLFRPPSAADQRTRVASSALVSLQCLFGLFGFPSPARRGGAVGGGAAAAD